MYAHEIASQRARDEQHAHQLAVLDATIVRIEKLHADICAVAANTPKQLIATATGQLSSAARELGDAVDILIIARHRLQRQGPATK